MTWKEAAREFRLRWRQEQVFYRLARGRLDVVKDDYEQVCFTFRCQQRAICDRRLGCARLIELMDTPPRAR